MLKIWDIMWKTYQIFQSKNIDQEENPEGDIGKMIKIEISIYKVIQFLQFHFTFCLITLIIVSISNFSIVFDQSTQNRCDSVWIPYPCMLSRHGCSTENEESKKYLTLQAYMCYPHLKYNPSFDKSKYYL